jgi:hypothetical protein
VDTFAVKEEDAAQDKHVYPTPGIGGAAGVHRMPDDRGKRGALPGIKSAEAYARELQEKRLPELRTACVHGKLKPGNSTGSCPPF